MGNITCERTETTLMPPGLYTATIEGIEPAESKFEPGKPQIKVKFLVEDEDFAGNTLTDWATLTLSRKSKLFGWVNNAVFGGRGVPDSYKRFDGDHLIGRRVFLNVTTRQGTDGEVYNKIESVLPHRVAKAQPAPVQTAQPPAKQPAAQPSDPPDWSDWPTPTDDDAPTDEG